MHRFLSEKKWNRYYISSRCNSLWWLSLEIELGSCSFHLERQTKSFSCLGSLAQMHLLCEQFRTCSDHRNKCHETRQKHTFFSSFLGGSAMVSFAGERRSTVEQRQGTTVWAESKTHLLFRGSLKVLKDLEAYWCWTHFQEKQLDKANL